MFMVIMNTILKMVSTDEQQKKHGTGGAASLRTAEQLHCWA
jgi:hypothetical protein